MKTTNKQLKEIISRSKLEAFETYATFYLWEEDKVHFTAKWEQDSFEAELFIGTNDLPCTLSDSQLDLIFDILEEAVSEEKARYIDVEEENYSGY